MKQRHTAGNSGGDPGRYCCNRLFDGIRPAQESIAHIGFRQSPPAIPELDRHSCGSAWLLAEWTNEQRCYGGEHRQAAEIAQRHLANDPRIAFHVGDGEFLEAIQEQTQHFDFIYADTWPGKYTHLTRHSIYSRLAAFT